MKTMFKTLSLAVVGSLITVAGAQAAGFAGASSDTNHIIIQPTGSNGPHHTVSGDVGVRVKSATGVFGQLTMGLPAYKHYTQNQIVQDYEVSTLNANILPPSHRSLGNFDFVQVPNQEVYFGEWTANRNNPNATHTVYYGGKNKADSLPSSGEVKYNVKGINKFNQYNLLSGELTANFSTNRLNGSLHRSTDFHDHILSIQNNKINPNDASFSGVAKFKAQLPYTNGGNLLEISNQPIRRIKIKNTRDYLTSPLNFSLGYTKSGKSEGHFFGPNGESLAGIATFNDRQFNTAFGGKKR